MVRSHPLRRGQIMFITIVIHPTSATHPHHPLRRGKVIFITMWTSNQWETSSRPLMEGQNYHLWLHSKFSGIWSKGTVKGTTECGYTCGATILGFRAPVHALPWHRGEDERLEVRHLCQCLSLLLMKGNAALLVNRVPEDDSVDPAVDGIE